MNQTNYLDRPVLIEAEFEITDDYVSIQSPHTLYIEAHRPRKLEQSALLELYKKMIRIAKSQNVSISYTMHCKKKLLEKWDEYELAIQKANHIFDLIKEQAEVVKARGLHNGTRDDEELDTLHDFHHAFIQLFWRDSIIFKMDSIYEYISTLLIEMECDDICYTKISA